MESRQARHGRTEKGRRRQCSNGAWQGKQVTGRVRVAHKTDCGELCELLPQTERERERDEEGEREREREGDILPAWICPAQTARQEVFTCNGKSKQKKKQSNLEQGKGK